MKRTIVRFRVGPAFGILEEGAIINGYLLASNNDCGLLYFPQDKNGCGCLIWCHCIDDDLYEDSDIEGEEDFVNIGYGIDTEFETFLKSLTSDGLKGEKKVIKKTAKPEFATVENNAMYAFCKTEKEAIEASLKDAEETDGSYSVVKIIGNTKIQTSPKITFERN